MMTMFVLANVLLWVQAHPEFMAIVVWPLVSCLLVALFKPRSAEEYAALPPRVAALLKLTSALGLDPLKAVEAVKQLVSGKSEEKK